MEKAFLLNLISQIKKNSEIFLEKELKKHNINDLDISHGSILSCLYKNNGKLTVNEIAVLIKRTKSTVSFLVDKLIKKGYLKKEVSKQDARCTEVSLTEKSKNIEAVLKKISDDLINKIYTDIGKDDEDVLLSSLKKINDNLKIT